MEKKRYFGLRKWQLIVFSIILALLIAVTSVMNTIVIANAGIIDVYLFGSNLEERTEYPEEKVNVIGTEIGEEGFVLLQNKEGCLPIETDKEARTKINLLGIQYINFIYGGGGSGSMDSSNAITLKESLDHAGFEINSELDEFNEKYVEDKSISNESEGIGLGSASDKVDEIPASQYAGKQFESFKTDESIALIVIARKGAERSDLNASVLKLSEEEKELLKYADDNFEKVIVILNTSNVMELGKRGEGEINIENCADAVIHVGSCGRNDLDALGKILSGEINPSGRTVDTWAYDVMSAPATANAGTNKYSNTDYPYITYAEGIYVGYRWYTTAAREGYLDYDEAVRYSFGHGLSYTDFEWTVGELEENDGKLSVDVTVTNIGQRDGKDVVEVYYTAPYDESEGIEKAHLVLAGFAKTKTIEAGGEDSDTVTIEWNISDMASYDYLNEKCYVLSAGDYAVHVMRECNPVNPDSTVKTMTYNVSDKQFIDKLYTDNMITNRFDHAAGTDMGIEYLSRANGFANYDSAVNSGMRQSGTALAERYLEMIPNSYNVNDTNYLDGSNLTLPNQQEQPLSKGQVEVKLYQLIGKDYDDPLWDTFLDQWTFDQLASFVCNGGFNPGGIAAFGVPDTVQMDGPQGLHDTFSSEKADYFMYPGEVCIASTWNTELANRMGQAIGGEASSIGASGWYGPGMNIHRSPLGGRNYEYYSECSTLTNKIAAAVVDGATSQGVICYIKHFVLNDQESNRDGTITWANEQAIREIYLKGFEGSVVEAHSLGVMSSFNRIGCIWAGADYSLLTGIIRDEWGFKGSVITDYYNGGYMNPVQGVRAGNDWYLQGKNAKSQLRDDYKENKTAVTYYTRQAAKNNLYALANSSIAMYGVGEGNELADLVSFTETAVKIWNIMAVIGIMAIVVFTAVKAVLSKRNKA